MDDDGSVDDDGASAGSREEDAPSRHSAFLPRGVSIIGKPYPGKPCRYGVRLRCARMQVRVGSRFCTVEAADKVARAFRDTVTFGPKTGLATVHEVRLVKYEGRLVECFTKYKSTRERVSIATVIRQWQRTWVIRSEQQRKRKRRCSQEKGTQQLISC